MDHIYKNIRNNWITEPAKELTFTLNGKEYLACWSDIEWLYKEDRKTPFRLTKLNYAAVNPLQRQCFDLVSKVFHDKTNAALRSKELIIKFKFNEGTAVLISLLTEWYKH